MCVGAAATCRELMQPVSTAAAAPPTELFSVVSVLCHRVINPANKFLIKVVVSFGEMERFWLESFWVPNQLSKYKEVSLPSEDPAKCCASVSNLLGLAVVDCVVERFWRSHVNPEFGGDSHLGEVAIVQKVVVGLNHQWSLQNFKSQPMESSNHL